MNTIGYLNSTQPILASIVDRALRMSKVEGFTKFPGPAPGPLKIKQTSAVLQYNTHAVLELLGLNNERTGRNSRNGVDTLDGAQMPEAD